MSVRSQCVVLAAWQLSIVTIVSVAEIAGLFWRLFTFFYYHAWLHDYILTLMVYLEF